MNYSLLLDFATDFGYELAMCGAETYRVEDSIRRILAAYGIDAEVFAITNNLTVSITCDDGLPMTRMRRIGYHGNDIYGVERFSALSRRICAEVPEPDVLPQWLEETRASKKHHSLPVHLLGNFLGAAGFGVFYGGSVIDGLCAGICGLLVGVINLFMDRLKANMFFRTLLAAFPMALLAYSFGALGIAGNPDAAVIGALMILVPGLIFTNAMRDIIYGDTNSGINRIVQVLLIAMAIVSGTAAAWSLASGLWGAPSTVAAIPYTFLQELLPCTIGCVGFAIIFNIHGPGMSLCALGGLFTWAVYRLTMYLGGTDLMAFFWACTAAAMYAEIMARIRKYPAIGYLLVSIFPLIPGAGIYYTMNYLVRGEMDKFVKTGMHTIAVAGVMAVGILLVSTTVRLWTDQKNKRHKKV